MNIGWARSLRGSRLWRAAGLRVRLVRTFLTRARHQRRARRLYAAFVRRGDLCFDVGANKGDNTAFLLGLGARVVAVEPQAACVARLRERFGYRRDVTLVAKALGTIPGEAEMNLGDADTISSLSPAWIESVKASGRFAGHRWDRKVTVPVTTLDQLIHEHGLPRFCKIDVEGFELEVLRGLTQPMPALSFEFTPEFLRAALDCVRYLDGLGRAQFNYSIEHTMRLSMPQWVDAAEISFLLTALPDPGVFGDVYARMR